MSADEKKLIIFDLDDTLVVSKSQMDREMASLLVALLSKKMVAIISGGVYGQFTAQVLSQINSASDYLKKLFLFPTNATCFYRYETGWKEVYAEMLSGEERKEIKNALEEAFVATEYKHPETVYGEVVEDRGTQITFSALGQKAPAELKKALKARWRSEGDPRIAIKKWVEEKLPHFTIRSNGMTSIDITRKGIDKAYGILQIEKNLGILKDEMLFIGDALFEGGNDYAVKLAGVKCIETSWPEETKKIIRSLLAD